MVRVAERNNRLDLAPWFKYPQDFLDDFGRIGDVLEQRETGYPVTGILQERKTACMSNDFDTVKGRQVNVDKVSRVEAPSSQPEVEP